MIDLIAFLIWLFVNSLSILLVVLVVKGFIHWENSKNHPIGNAYLTGIVFLLPALYLYTILLLRRKEREFSVWHVWHLLDDWTSFTWYIPVLWFYIATIVCASLVSLYFSTITESLTENLKRIVGVWGLAGFLGLSVIFILEILLESSFGLLFLKDITYLWCCLGILILTLILIVKTVAHWGKLRNRPISYSYIVGIMYLVIITILVISFYPQKLITSNWLFFPIL